MVNIHTRAWQIRLSMQKGRVLWARLVQQEIVVLCPAHTRYKQIHNKHVSSLNHVYSGHDWNCMYLTTNVVCYLEEGTKQQGTTEKWANDIFAQRSTPLTLKLTKKTNTKPRLSVYSAGQKYRWLIFLVVPLLYSAFPILYVLILNLPSFNRDQTLKHI